MNSIASFFPVKVLFLCFMVLSFFLSANAQTTDFYKGDKLFTPNGNLPFRIMLPEGFDEAYSYPLIFFLHGAGERGNDNVKQLMHGASFFASAENRKEFPAIVVFPQCAEGDFWANVKFHSDEDGSRSLTFDPAGEPTPSMALAITLLESLLERDYVDKQKVYVGGLSMGGMGTFELLYRMPEVFAAAFPICGGGNPDMINEAVKQVNVWAFHGEEDRVVPPDLSVKMVEAFQRAGVPVKLTLYPGVGHDSWNNVFEEPEFLNWLFSNKR